MAAQELVEVKARVPADLHHRFIQLLPMHGSISWVMRTIMESFVDELEREPRLAERVQRAVHDSTK